MGLSGGTVQIAVRIIGTGGRDWGADHRGYVGLAGAASVTWSPRHSGATMVEIGQKEGDSANGAKARVYGIILWEWEDDCSEGES
jgi:hypothetical protein